MPIPSTIVATFHLINPFKRRWRRRATPRDEPDSPLQYSWIHCFTTRPITAADRPRMSAENHVMFNHTIQRGGRDGGEISDEVRPGAVELMKPPPTLKLASWSEIVCNTARVGSMAGGCRSGYDWTLNAVTTAEKRPACIMRVSGRQGVNRALCAHEDKMRVNFLFPPLHCVVTVYFYHFRGLCPCVLFFLLCIERLSFVF